MTWKSFHNRGEILREVLAVADERMDGILPMDVDGVTETFADELTLLGALQLRWHTRLAGRIERELLTQPMDLEAAVIRAWVATAEELPGVRAIVDRHRVDPLTPAMAEAMAKSMAKEHILLAIMAGASSASDSLAVRVGEDIANRARTAYHPRVPAHRGQLHVGLRDRLRAVLAA